ncbi:MAG: tetratricopeptide repeat protein, partial [Syntrophales bacterium]|nr:tetratricopeptide repeat protein [Syntrophales bacterium]
MPEGIFLQKEEAVFPAGNNPPTIVSEESRISDDDARFHLARLLAGEEATEGEALVLFQILIEKRPDDPEILASLADLALNTGHAAESRRLYLRIVEIDKTEARRLAYAERMTAWGDFYGAEWIYRGVLADHPRQREILLKLADLLFAMQRTAEAEEICRKILLREPDARDVLLLMVRLKMKEKDFLEAEKWSRQVIAMNQENVEAKLLLSEILTARQRFGEAIALYQEAETLGAMPAAALGIGRVCIKEGKSEEGSRAFSRALDAAPRDVEARFRAAGPKRITDKKFIEELFRTEKSSRRLNRWAELYATEGRMKEAIRIYEVILARDPGFFPAQTALAELLALDGRFEEAIALYQDLSNRFPATSKIQIGKARALSWAKRYREALNLYFEICRFNPRDPVPVMEMARTAVWGKWYEEAHAIYSKLLEPSVDLSFQKALQSATRGIRNERLRAAIQNLEKGAARDFITEAYKGFQNDFERFSHNLSREDKRLVEEILLDFFATSRIQRKAALERQAKELVWNKRPRNAIPVYR